MVERDPKTIHPNEPIAFGFFEISPDIIYSRGCLINATLQKADLKERLRLIQDEDHVIAEGIWTPEEALEVAGSIKLENGNFKVDSQLFMEDELKTSFKVKKKILSFLQKENIIIPSENHIHTQRYILNYPSWIGEDSYETQEGVYRQEISITPVDDENIILTFQNYLVIDR